MKVEINFSGKRGTMTVTPTWTITLFERAKGFPGRKRMIDKVLHFEKSPDNLAYARSAFPNAEMIGQEDQESLNLVDHARMNFKTAYEPTDLQVEAFSRARGKKLFAYFLKPGSGKTKACLDHAVDMWCQGEIDGIFVLSYAGVHEQWVLDEAEKHIHKDIPWEGYVWIAGKKFDENAFKRKKNVFRIVAMNYESFAVSPKGYAVAQKYSTTGAIMCIADESQRLKSDDSQVANRAVNNREMWQGGRIIATGEPTPLGLEDYYKQMSFLDPAILQCFTFTAFKGQFCRMGGHENLKVVGYHNTEILHERMAPYVHVGAPDIDARQIFEVSRFNLGPKARDAYDQLKNDMMVLIEEAEALEADAVGSGDPELREQVFYRMRSILPMQTKLLEITCERLTNQDGEVVEFENNRMKLLDSLLGIAGPQKSIIWSVFKADHVAQAEMLGSKASVYNGDTPKNQRREILKEFLDPTSKLQYLIASKAAAGTGLNLQGVCRRNIFYSDNNNAGQRWQADMRTYRLGVTDDVLYTDILARSTCNVGIFNSNKRKREVSDMSVAEFKSMMLEDTIDESFLI